MPKDKVSPETDDSIRRRHRGRSALGDCDQIWCRRVRER